MTTTTARPDHAFDDRTAEETRRLVEWASSTAFESLPPHVIDRSRDLILDHLGVAIAGIDHEATPIALDLVRELGGSPTATIVADGHRTSPANVALVNGISSHVHDFDDTHIPTILHPTGPVMAAALPLAEARSRSGRDLIRAHTIGVEVSARASRTIFPEHYDAGWHMSGTTGTLGAAVAAGLVIGLPPEALVHAIGIAATQASGHREQFGTMTKSFHVGRAASNGVLAALLAERGYTAAPDSLQGRRGMFAVMSTGSRPEMLTSDLGTAWEIFDIGIKPYACGVVAHPPIDAVRRLRTEHAIAPGEIDRIRLLVNPLVLELTGKREPRTGLEGKFSVTFCSAIAMIEGTAGPRQFTDEAVVRDDVVALRDRIEPEADERLNHAQATAIARLRDGREVSVEVHAASGTPENPLSRDDLAAKFRELVTPLLRGERTEHLLDLASRLEAVRDAGELVAATVADGTRG